MKKLNIFKSERKLTGRRFYNEYDFGGIKNPKDPKKFKLLIVSKNKLLKMIAIKLGFDVYEVSSIEDGIELLKAQSFDAVLTSLKIGNLHCLPLRIIKKAKTRMIVVDAFESFEIEPAKQKGLFILKSALGDGIHDANIQNIKTFLKGLHVSCKQAA